MKNRIALLLLFVFFAMGFQNLFAQNSADRSVIYLHDKSVLLGNIADESDSTYRITFRADNDTIIKKNSVDSLKKLNDHSTTYKSDRVVGLLLSTQFTTGGLMRTNKNPLGESQSISSFNMGVGILIGKILGLSLIPTIETYKEKKYFLIYPDAKIILGDEQNTVNVILEANYFSNQFFGLSQGGYSSNLMGGLSIGDDTFRFTLMPGFEFVNDYQFFKVGIGFNITP